MDELPDIYEIPEDQSIFPIFDQKQTPTCVAHAVVSSMQKVWYKKLGKIITFSPRFIDILSWTDNLGVNDGRYGPTVLELFCKIGCCTEILLPNYTSLPTEQYRDKSLITQEMMDEAAQYKMPNYEVVTMKFPAGHIAYIKRKGT